jgi:MtrB/PioB family decaheme-associated outer membrane protein
MSASKSPMQYALLVAALMQILPTAAMAAKADKDDDKKGKACGDCPDYSGWTKWFELGIGVQSDDSYHFGRYTGLTDDGAFLNANGEVTYRAKDNGDYMNAKVVDLGLESRNVSLEAGRQGKYGVTIDYDQIPNYLKQYPGVSIKTERDRTGIKFSTIPGKDWEITGFYRHEKKDGTKEVGATFGFSQTQILPVAFNYETNDFGLNLGYKGERFQALISYAGSLFNNDNTAITWPNTSPPPATGQIAESPDNQSHQISALLGYQLTDKTRIGAKLAFGHMTQDQDFLPYSYGGTLPTTSSLSGEVNTTLAKFDISSRPSPKLRLEGSYTYSDRDNNTPVNTYNYVITDTIPSLDARQNRPYSFEQNLLRLKAGYRLPKDADLSGGFDYDKMDRTYQQVTETEDKTLWAQLKLHPTDSVEARLKLSHATRDASAPETTSPAAAYQNPSYPESGVDYFGATLPNPLMLAFELADRTRDKIGFDVSYTPTEKLTLGFALDYYKDDYKNMELGLTNATGLTFTPSLTYVFSEDLTASTYYTYEKLDSDQSGREWITGVNIGDWAESDSNKTQTIGLNVNWKAIPKKLDLGADLVYADFSGKIQYPGSTDLPELTSTLTAIGVHGVYKKSDDVSFRADYWYERYKNSDWANVTLPTVATLGVTPPEQETHLIYFSVRYAFK